MTWSKQKPCRNVRITPHPCQKQRMEEIIIILTEITTDITTRNKNGVV